MADKDLKIGIRTEATGDGAKKTAEELDKVADATKRVAITTEQGRAGRRDIAQFLDDTADRGRSSSIAFYDLDAQMSRTANTSEKVAGAMVKMTGPTKNNAAALLEFSRAAEDAQYGVRGVLNNIPTLVAALGGGAGLAGGISLLAVGLTTLIPLLQKAFGGDMLKKAGIDLQKIREEAEKFAASGFDDLMERVNDNAAARELQAAKNAAKTSETSARDAAGRDAALQQLDNRDKAIGATNDINSLLGLPTMPVDNSTDLARINIELEKQLATQNASIEAERKKVAEIEDGKFKIVDTLADYESEKAVLESILRRNKEWTAELEATKTKVRELREEADKLSESAEKAARGLGGPLAGDAQSLAASGKLAEAAKLEASLRPAGDPEFFKSPEEQATLERETTQLEIAKLDKKIAALATKIEGSDVAIQNATVELEDKEAALATTVESLKETAKLEGTIEQIEQVKEDSAAAAEKVKGFVAEVEASGKELTEAEKKAVGELKKLTVDNQLAKNETFRAHDAIATLQADTLSGIRRIIRLGEDARADINSLNSRISALESQPRPSIPPIPPAPHR